MTPKITDPTLRTKKTQKIYVDYVTNKYDHHCIFCAKDDLIKEYEHWILVENKYPYDAIFSTHNMLAPKAHVTERTKLYKDEIEELDELLQELDYDMCILNKKKRRSIPQHYHLHLVKL